MLDSHFENLWADNSVENLGCHPIADYVEAEDNDEKQAIIA